MLSTGILQRLAKVRQFEVRSLRRNFDFALPKPTVEAL
jgi:hypothetical protein